MHIQPINDWQHTHDFACSHHKGERRTKLVLLLTVLTMLLEIIAGIRFGSMALLADGWHMATHVAAFMIALTAYRYSRRHAHDDTFAFSTAKVSLLGGFASSIALGVVALIMLIEALQRLWLPQAIHFNEAIGVALFGLLINLLSAILLQHGPHDHSHVHHHDHNLKAAYAHVLADALTSILAIIALLCAKYYHWFWLDPIMAIVGAIIISHWSIHLVKETAPVLLDESIPLPDKLAISKALENDTENTLVDLHIWRLGAHHYAVIAVLVTQTPKPPSYYKHLLTSFQQLKHITIEVHTDYKSSIVDV